MKEFIEQAGVKDTNSFPFVIIGNKTDLERVVDQEKGESYAKKLGKSARFFETSAKDGRGIEDAFKYAIEKTSSMVKDDDLYVAPTLNLNKVNKPKKKKKGCCKR